jgi:hypothetical protein
MTRLAPYAGEKGKLRFLRCERMPYSLIGEIASVRARQNAAKAAQRTAKRTRGR